MSKKILKAGLSEFNGRKLPSISESYLRARLSETEEKLRMTSHELQELKAGIDETMIVSITNIRGEIIYANKMMTKITGYSIEEVIGKKHNIFKSGHHESAFYKNLWKTLLRGEIWRGEIKNKAKDGSFFWVDTTIIPFVDANGDVYQFMSIRKDITERKRIEEQAEREHANREYAGRLTAVGEMAANVAHEIRNPLAAILLRIQLANRAAAHSQNVPQDLFQKTNGDIERLVHRIEKIIDGIRLFSRDGRGEPFEKVQLSNLIHETLDYFGAKFEKAGISLIVDQIPSTIHIKCRSIQLSQVFLNLLNNAFDAVQGLSEKWVKISVFDSCNEAVIAITDSGNGIPAELNEKIMRPYFTTKPVGKGTGLGLSISNEIVRAHHGTLTMDPTKPNTTFIVSIPIPKDLQRASLSHARVSLSE